MFYINDKGNLQVGEHPGEGWIEVNDPKSSFYRLKANWKECIPDVWEFNPFKVSTQLNFLVDTVVGDKLAKAYNTYINELIAFKIEAQKDIDSIKSEDDVVKVTNKIKRIAENISLGPIDPTIFK